MAVRGTNTMQEALQSLLQEISQMKTLADADLPWLVELESMVLSKIREPLDAQQQQGANPGMAPPPGGGMGGGMGLPAGMGVPGGGGMQAGAAMPNPDELQRLLSAGQ